MVVLTSKQQRNNRCSRCMATYDKRQVASKRRLLLDELTSRPFHCSTTADHSIRSRRPKQRETETPLVKHSSCSPYWWCWCCDLQKSSVVVVASSSWRGLHHHHHHELLLLLPMAMPSLPPLDWPCATRRGLSVPACQESREPPPALLRSTTAPNNAPPPLPAAAAAAAAPYFYHHHHHHFFYYQEMAPSSRPSLWWIAWRWWEAP